MRQFITVRHRPLPGALAQPNVVPFSRAVVGLCSPSDEKPRRRRSAASLIPGFGLALWLIFVFGLLPEAHASASPRNPRFENIGTEEGLPVTAVEALLQDHDGFVWFGTEAGLIRYDGFRFVYYRNVPGDPTTLGSNLVNALEEDAQGAIWVGTIGGLFRLSPDRMGFDAFLPDEGAERGKGNRTIRELLLTEDQGEDGLWVATADGLQRLNTASGQFRYWHRGPADQGGLGSNDVFALERDGAGRLWIGTSAGVDRLDPRDGSVTHFDLDGGARANTVTRLLVENDERLWIGTGAGLFLWSIPAGDAQPSQLPLPEALRFDDVVRALFKERDGAVWVGTQNGGAYRVDESSIQHYLHRADDPHSLADDSVVSILQDRSGSLWLGTWYNGLSRLDVGGSGFERHTAVADPKERLSDSLVYHVATDPDGGVWFGLLRGGIDYLGPDSTELRHFRFDALNPNGLPSDLIRCAVPDRRGAVWVGTQQDGFGLFDPDSGRFIAVEQQLDPPELRSIRTIAVAHDNVVWVGSEGGLLRHDPADGSLRTYVHDPARADSLSQGRVLSLLLDRSGQVWIGTETGLDLMIDPAGRFEHFQHDPTRADGLSQSLVADIHEDAQRRIWVGTGAGLELLTRNSDGSVMFRSYTVRDGLADDTINAIENDNRGRLWLSTDSGISRLDPSNGEVRNYTERDGVTSGSFFVHSSTALPDGTLVFGGSHGAVSFQPEEILENTVPPPVRITELQVSGELVKPADRHDGVTLTQPIEFLDELQLGPSVSDFTLEFAALHYADSSRNQFAYQLQGFDRDFILTDAAKPRATYTNLDPGQYQFRVRAANKDGVWNEEGAHLTIIVLPPWWATWWFRAFALAATVAILAWAYRRRVSFLESNRLQLEASVRSRTAELAQQTHRLEKSLSQVERTHREVSLLGELSAALQGSDDMTVACQRIAAFGPQLFPSSSGALYLQQPEVDAWDARSVWGGLSPASLNPKDCRAIAEGTPVGHPRDDGQPVCTHIDAPGNAMSISACLPLVAQGTILGLLCIRHDDGPDAGETSRRQAVAASMAEQTALALANLELRAALLEQSVRDPLTGLFNRRRLQESLSDQLADCLQANRSLVLLMIDIDHFKDFNDAHGHAAGDSVLQSVANTLQERARSTDVVCRYGGEELAVLLPDTTVVDAIAVADAMLESVRRTTVSHDGKTLPPVTLSLGLAVFPEDGATADALLKASDRALYKAKSGGRDRMVQHASLD